MKTLLSALILLSFSQQSYGYSAQEYRDLSLEEPTSNATEMDSTETRLIEQLASSAPQHSGIFEALKSYHRYKKAHPQEAKVFRKNARTLRDELKNPDSSIAIALKLAKEVCGRGSAQCRQAMSQLVQPQMEAILNPTSTAWIDSFLPKAYADGFGLSDACTMDMGPNFNAIFFGIFDYGNCSRGNSLEITTLGPGLFLGANLGMVFVCSSDGGFNGTNFGITAGAAALVGADFGIFFGDNGICTKVGINAGIGAYAGLALLYMNP